MDTMIRLEELTKQFPGQKGEVAVDSVTMDIPEGDIVVLVGPSGSGKTTTLKMINRVIEPTSGRIFLEGEDVTQANPDHLRRRIGYVIQQIGLFPHMTIAANISTVPKLLGWDKQRITDRVDELLEMVGMPPDTYRGRYPKELSGGQRQRVGVARALAADPPVMLMDEPFGAIDPITRERLQNEFLRLQEDMQKTIVFVTHDIDEAVKMGDRIAIFGDDHRIQQFDTPESILSEPANDFVSDFTGSGSALKRLSLSRVRDIDFGEWPTVAAGTDPDELDRRLKETRENYLLLLDEQGRPQAWVGERELSRPDEAGLPVSAIVEERTTLHEALNQMLSGSVGVAVVVDDDDRYEGVVGIQGLMSVITEGDGQGAQAASPGSAETEHLRG